MAKKKITENQLTKDVKNNPLLIGKKSVMRGLRKGTVKKIYLANNISDEIRVEIEQSASITGVSVELSDINSEDLGALNKKQFSISVIGIL